MLMRAAQDMRALLFVRSTDGRITSANAQSTHFLGRTPAEAIGELWSDYFAVDGAGSRESGHDQDAGHTVLEGDLHTWDGRSLRVELREGPAEFDQNLTLGVVVEITDRREREARLQQSQRMENLGMLAAGIAHDLNNILAPILIAGSMLKPAVQDDKQKRMLDILQSSAERGAQIVRQILGFSQQSSGDLVRMNPRHVARDLILMVEETFPRNITCEDDLARDLHEVLVNPTQIYQVLLNLCINARDAMPKGGLLRVEAAKRELTADRIPVPEYRTQTHWVCYTVTDTGVGIPADKLDSIWTPFYTTKQDSGGTGLGLATARGIIMKHGGFIEVSSRVGRGTSFEVYLPAAPSTDQPKFAPGRADDLPRGAGERILVVDDEAAVREMVRTTLVAAGYRVTVATQGVDALSLYNIWGNELALVITDMHMPGMAGDLFGSVLRRLAPDLPILSISGHPDAIERWKESGTTEPNRFLTKPFGVAELHQTVHEMLEAHKAATHPGLPTH